MAGTQWSLLSSGAFDEDFERLSDKAEWSGFDGRSMLLTGATGFFGLWLIEFFDWLRRNRSWDGALHLLTRDREKVLDRYPIYRQRPWIQLVGGDIRSFSPPAQKIDFFVHGATDTSAEMGRRPQELLDVIYGGTRHVLDIAAQSDCKRILFISSGAVYGPIDRPERVSEACRTAPDVLSTASAYGEGKRIGEALGAFAAQSASFEMVIARCFAFVGAGLPLHAHFAIGNFIRDALENKPILLNSTGKSWRSYLYAADLVIWLMTLLLRGRSSTAYNVGSDQILDIWTTACLVRDVLSPSLSVTVAPNALTTTTYYVPSIERARTELGLDVWTSPELAVRRTAEDARRLGPFR
jgi:nucleoside-diphosphate-sugar epimerase